MTLVGTSLKPTLPEFNTMQYMVKYTVVPRATAVDRFERSVLGDIQRGLAVQDAVWHNTEPGQKGPLQDIVMDICGCLALVCWEGLAGVVFQMDRVALWVARLM
eukprot:jgi/Tetstr1/422963/TSEL_013741.t1